ncbi:hypothetical protein SASPL_120402 [Salvia splendens]|uniref:Uncharacterized protein n=1 Tax=Salvia splendens TaxID=180675 RepID=A0A8X8ZTX8_SALSN|nr:hypothetical protein SASPL_120402 [Salvia splendens]
MSGNGKGKRICEGNSSGIGVAKGGNLEKVKGDRTLRTWTKREEEILVIALHDLVAGGWKADNGFRPGYATRVYQVTKCEIPDTQLKVSPHINSKITTWRIRNSVQHP